MEPEDEVRPGWLPPRPPAVWEPPRPVTPYGAPRTPHEPRADAPRPSPQGRIAIVLGATSVVLLVMTIGVGYPLCGLLSALALYLGLRSKRRPAIVLAGIGLGLAIVAALTWAVLESNGITPQDLEQWLRDEVERRRDGASARRTVG